MRDAVKMGGGFSGAYTDDQGVRHQMTPEQAESLWKSIEENRERIATLMPDEKTAIRMMTDAFHRLRDFGWSEAIYCPKDGREFKVIEAGSSGIHSCVYSGEWPDGHWLISDGGDIYPSRPILHRLNPEDEAARKARIEKARAKYSAAAAVARAAAEERGKP
jgi:hypothetical protein